MGSLYLRVRSSLRVATSLAIAAAVAGQLQYLSDNDLLNPVNFFSYFTMLSNVLACLMLVGLELRAGGAMVLRWLAGRLSGRAAAVTADNTPS